MAFSHPCLRMLPEIIPEIGRTVYPTTLFHLMLLRPLIRAQDQLERPVVKEKVLISPEPEPPVPFNLHRISHVLQILDGYDPPSLFGRR